MARIRVRRDTCMANAQVGIMQKFVMKKTKSSIKSLKKSEKKVSDPRSAPDNWSLP